MYKKHSLEERLLAVKKCLEGLSPRCVGRQLGINSSYISEWLYKYQREGNKGLEKRPNIRANFAENAKLFAHMLKKVYLCIVLVQTTMYLSLRYAYGHASIVREVMVLCAR
jgi:hypothetical protein